MSYFDMMRRERRIDVEYDSEIWKLLGEKCDGYIFGVLEGVSGEGAWYTSLSAHDAEEKHLRYFAKLTNDEYERVKRLIRNRYETYPNIKYYD